MGRKESTVELLVKVWEGIREFLEVPNEGTGSFFRHMRVHTSRDRKPFDCIALLGPAFFVGTWLLNVIKFQKFFQDNWCCMAAYWTTRIMINKGIQPISVLEILGYFGIYEYSLPLKPPF